MIQRVTLVIEADHYYIDGITEERMKKAAQEAYYTRTGVRDVPVTVEVEDVSDALESAEKEEM